MLAERWQCSERHIRNLVAAGDLRAFKLGGRLIRISFDAIEEYEARNTSAPSSDNEAKRHAANKAARLVRLTRR